MRTKGIFCFEYNLNPWDLKAISSLRNILFFFCCSGYDFGYLVKLLTDARLPEEEHDFFQILNLFFPAIYDVKYLMKSCKSLKVCLHVSTSCIGSRLVFFSGGWTHLPAIFVPQGGLQEVADQLELKRIGRQHQAGSDSLLTGMAFFRMKEVSWGSTSPTWVILRVLYNED